MAVQDSNQTPSLRDLASSEPKLRRAALQTISTYLTSPTRPPLAPTPTLQLWRALTITLLMHDSKNAISVQNLTKTLASLFTSIAERDDDLPDSDEDSTPDLEIFTSAFWETMAREYPSVDALRVDKLLLLIRFAVRETFHILFRDATSSLEDAALASRRESRLTSQMTLFAQWPLSPRERKMPDGIRYHVLDLWVDELETVKAESEAGSIAPQADDDDGGKETDNDWRQTRFADTVERLMQPVQTLAKEGLNKHVRMRAKGDLASAMEKGLSTSTKSDP